MIDQQWVFGVHITPIYLVEAILATITDIDDLDDLCSQTRIEHITLAQLGLEVRATSKDKSGHVDFVVRNEMLDSQFSNLADVVVALFITKTGETKGGLTTTTVLLGEIDREFVDDFTRIASDSTEQGTVTVHDDETEPLIRFKKFGQGLCVEFIVAQVERTSCPSETKV